MVKKSLGLLLILSTMAFGKTVTLEEAIDKTLENSKSVKIAEKDILVGKENVSIAFKSALPLLNYTGQYQASEKKRQMGALRNEMSKTGYTQSIGLTQPIVNGGVIIGAIMGSGVYEDNFTLAYLGAKRDARLQAISVYSNILNAKKDLKILNDSKKQLGERYNKQAELLKLRLITKAEILKTEYSILDIESQIQGVENTIDVESKRLKVLTGMNSDETLEVVDFSIPTDITAKINFAEDLKHAKENSLNIRQVMNSLELAKIDNITKAGAMLPQVSAFGKYGTFVESKNLENPLDKGEWRGGINFNWNIFQFGKDIDALQASLHTKDKAEINLTRVQEEVEINLTTAYLELVRLEKSLVSVEKAVKSTEESYKLDKERLDAGLITTVDFLLTEVQYRQASTNYNKMLNGYYMAYEKYRSLLI